LKESIITRINQTKLTKKEREIADHILQNLNTTAFLSGIQLAKETQVSATLITRFIQKLGYSKFPEFKNDLEELYRKTNTPYEVFQNFMANSEDDDISNHSIAQDIQNITTMKNILQKEAFDIIVEAIEQADTVYLAAMFASEAVTQIFSYHLNRLKKPFVLLSGVGISKQIEYSSISSSDILICVSSQRILREVRDVAIYAVSQGIKTVAITDSPTNPLATACDYFLLTPVTGSVFDYSLTAPITMVNAIVNTLAAKYPNKLSAELETIEKRWNDKNLFCT
jgi:DNA-binding MurR/RpiR family transcriptional regulator